MSELDLPDDMPGAVKEALEFDYLTVGYCRYEKHENGYRRLTPRPINEGEGNDDA